MKWRVFAAREELSWRLGDISIFCGCWQTESHTSDFYQLKLPNCYMYLALRQWAFPQLRYLTLQDCNRMSVFRKSKSDTQYSTPKAVQSVRSIQARLDFWLGLVILLLLSVRLIFIKSTYEYFQEFLGTVDKWLFSGLEREIFKNKHANKFINL